MASLAGVLLAPVFGAFNSDDFVTLTVDGHRRGGVGAAALAADRRRRRRPHRRGRPRCCRATSRRTASGTRPSCPSLPFLAIVAALLILPGHAQPGLEPGPLATIDPPPPPIAATTRAPSMDRIIRTLWWVLFAGFFVSMLTWIPITWETVFNNGLTLSIILLSITLITGMAGQLSLCQATLAGIGAFTAAQLAEPPRAQLPRRRPRRCRVGGRRGRDPGAAVAAPARPGTGLMTLAAALLFDSHLLQRRPGSRAVRRA